MAEVKALGLLAATVSVLLASTTAYAAGGQAGFVLTGTGGVAGFNMPTYGSGYFGHSANDTLFGGMFGANLTGQVGKSGDWDILVGLSAFGAWGTGTTSSTDTLSGTGTVVITGGSLPNDATITVGTSGGNSATVTATDNNPQTGTATGTATTSGVVSNVGFVQPTDTGPGFVVGGVTSGNTTPGPAAFGAAADTSGGIFVGTGDLSGIQIGTSITRSVQYFGGDVTIGANGHLNETTQLEFYGGPSVRELNEQDNTSVTATMSATQPSATTFPNFSLANMDSLSSLYMGGVVGTSLAFSATPGVQVNIGGELGLYDAKSSYSGQSKYSTCCGNFVGTPPVDGASPSESVTAPGSSADLGNRFGFAVRGNGGVTFAIGSNKTLTLAGNAEYLSAVPQISRSSLVTVTPGAGTAGTSTGATAGAPSFTFGSMVDWGASLGLSGSFD